jgi:hypothetical protein
VSGYIKTLAALGLIQVALIVVVWFKPFDSQLEAGALIQIDAERIAYIKIIDSETSIMLRPDNENWSDGVTVNDKYIGDSKKASAFISQILELKAQWALTQTSEAVKRFEVSDSNYQRKVELYDPNDQLLETFFTGTSPEFGKVHARVSKNNSVYAVDIANHQISTNVDDWIDKSQLALTHLPSEVIIDQPLKTEDFSLAEIEGSAWQINGNIADEQKVNDYLVRFKNFQILGISNAAEGSQARLATINLISDEAGIVFNFYKSVDDEFSVTISTQNHTFRVAEYWINQLLINETDLLPSEKDLDSSVEINVE